MADPDCEKGRFTVNGDPVCAVRIPAACQLPSKPLRHPGCVIHLRPNGRSLTELTTRRCLALKSESPRSACGSSEFCGRPEPTLPPNTDETSSIDLEKVYAARKVRPWPTRLSELNCRELYELAAADST